MDVDACDPADGLEDVDALSLGEKYTGQTKPWIKIN